jgi:hypothetical protein
VRGAVWSVICAAVAFLVVGATQLSGPDRAEGPTGATAATLLALLLTACGIASALWSMRRASGKRRQIAFAGFLANMFVIIGTLALALDTSI